MDKPHAHAAPAAHPADAGRRPGDESPYEYYRRSYRDAPYFSSGRAWSDYAPAYRYAMEQADALDVSAASFEAIEPRLEHGWDTARDGSRLTWTEARAAIRHVFEDAADRRRGDGRIPD
ncbi:hypothetical protein LDO32_10500 [Luteimonas sp. Y-2-2-4F]|nr:hypothetical protein [Luteimonas sp. Y-2-2-4F]MCD9032152.1 hypothetical protein [Luteimonas sp. Y-2-2-4F]